LRRISLFLIIAAAVVFQPALSRAAERTVKTVSLQQMEDTGRAAASLKSRLVVSGYYSGDLMSVLQLTGETDTNTVRSLYLKGQVLESLGLDTEAADVYQEALEASGEPDSWWSRALSAYLRLHGDLPGSAAPRVEPQLDTMLGSEAAMDLGNYLLDGNGQERAVKLLGRAARGGDDLKILSGLAMARHHANSGNWKKSADILTSLKPSKTSALADLVYLTRGYHLMESGSYSRARDSFLTIGPRSPYAPESLLGHAWALIRQDDLSGAVIRLEELLKSYPDTEAARQGAVDLSLCYRELGLYEQAGDLLQKEARRLGEFANWAGAMQSSDFYPGQDLADILEAVIHGEAIPEKLLAKTPPHVRTWVKNAASDPYVRRTTALLGGVEVLDDIKGQTVRWLKRSDELTGFELVWADRDLGSNLERSGRLKELKARLPMLDADMKRSLGENSLDKFSTETSLSLITRIRDCSNRLEIMENTVKKAEKFSPLIESLSSSVTVTREEEQLNRIRESAYEGLVSSRSTLGQYRSTLRRLEGRVWLGLKGRAVELEQSTSERVKSSIEIIDKQLADTERTRELLTKHRAILANLKTEISSGSELLGNATTERLTRLRTDIIEARAHRLVQLAEAAAADFREEQARALYTAADIEINRMERNIKAMQETAQ
jgi:tetratricopeptide (TPR) repeat protein